MLAVPNRPWPRAWAVASPQWGKDRGDWRGLLLQNCPNTTKVMGGRLGPCVSASLAEAEPARARLRE